MAAPAKRTIELFYDVISPYSWIAFETLLKYKGRWNLDLKLNPFFLAGVMKATDNPGMMMNRLKVKYLRNDVARLSEYHNLPLKFPSDAMHTFGVKGTLQPCRLLTATSMYENHALENLSRQLWLRIWSWDMDITEPGSLIKAGIGAGLPEETAQRLVSRMNDQVVKDKLTKQTEAAVEHGAFGSPTIVVHDAGGHQMFFGADRFHLIADLIGKKYEGPLTD